MALILDTNALSAFVDGVPGLQSVIERETDLALPVIVLGEYLFGVRASRYRQRYERWLDLNLVLFDILAITRTTADHYADLRSELRIAGQPIPTNDLWIAALGREHNFRIATRDNHLKGVRGLTIVSW